MTITVYTQSNCQACTATTRKLDQLGVPYTVAPFSEHGDIQRLAQELGYTTAPVVVVENNGTRMSWCGYRPTNLKGLLG